MIEIKRLKSDRWREYRKLRLEALKSEPTAFGGAYEDEKKSPESRWRKRIRNVIFALSNDKPVGMIVHVFDELPKSKHIVNIYGVYVNRSYRGQGVGELLLKRALSEIQKNRGAVKAKLTVNPEQRAAVKLYKKNGFVVVGRMEKELKFHGKFFDELAMERLL